MSSRQAIPLAGVFCLLAAAGIAGWFLAVPLAVAPPPELAVPEEVAVAPAPRLVVERDDPVAEMQAVVALARSLRIDPDPRDADAKLQPLLARFRAVRAALKERRASADDGREREQLDAQLRQLNGEEAKLQERLSEAAGAWLSSGVDLPGRVGARMDAMASLRKRALRDAVRSVNPATAEDATAALAHLRRTQVEAIFDRVVGKDHGDVGQLITDILLVDGGTDRLEAIDDGVLGAAQVHATWRGELAARFATSPKDVPPPEVAVWLLSGCYREAKAGGPSGADFAFLDPARNPDLAKAAATRPFRRLVQEWAANQARDPAAIAAAAALLMAGEK